MTIGEFSTMNDLGLSARADTIDEAAEVSGCGGGCSCSCGSQASETGVPASAALGPVTARYNVTGMTCNHCVLSVTEEMFDLDGVQNVSIELDATGVSTVTVLSAAVLDNDDVRAAVTAAGYTLV